jgi:phosphopantetheine adenylyltransferase
MDKQLIGEYLIRDDLVTPEQLTRALEVQAARVERGKMPLVGTILIEMGAVNAQDLAFALAEQERDRMRVTN